MSNSNIINGIDITKYTGLAKKVSDKYAWGVSASICTDDLYQCALMGLMRAARMYNHDSGHRFSTYAYFWLKAYVKKEINTNMRVVRIPEHVIVDKMSVNKATRKAICMTSEEPTLDYIEQETGIKEEKLKRINAINTRHATSLDKPDPDAGMYDSYNWVSSKFGSSSCPISGLHIQDAISKLRFLSKKEREIMKMRHEDEMDFGQIGAVHGVTREAIRQRYEKSLVKCRKRFMADGVEYSA